MLKEYLIVFKPLVKDCIQIHLGPDSEIPSGWTKCDGRDAVNGKTIPNLTNRFIYVSNTNSSSLSNSDNQPVTNANYSISDANHSHKSRNNFNYKVENSGAHRHTFDVTLSATYYYTNSVTGVTGASQNGNNNYKYKTVATTGERNYTSNAISAVQNDKGGHTHSFSSANTGNTASEKHTHNISGTKVNSTRPERISVCFIIWTGL